MTNNVRQLARALRRSAESSGRGTVSDSFHSAVQDDWTRIERELSQSGETVVRDSDGRAYRIERAASQ